MVTKEPSFAKFTEPKELDICGGGMRQMCYDSRRIDITAGNKMFTFDTHALIKNLIASGLPSEQAESLVDGMVQVMHAELHHMNTNLVTKEQQEIMMQQIMAHLAAMKKDMIILEKSEFSQLKHEYEKQNLKIEQIRRQLDDELTKVKSGVSLDMNLERSRAKEAHSENEGKLGHLQNNMDLHQSSLQQEISKTDNKIDKEIANLLATYERYRNDVMKFAAGAVMTCLTITLGFYRLWS